MRRSDKVMDIDMKISIIWTSACQNVHDKKKRVACRLIEPARCHWFHGTRMPCMSLAPGNHQFGL